MSMYSLVQNLNMIVGRNLGIYLQVYFFHPRMALIWDPF